MEKKQENGNLMRAYERLHKEYCYLEEECSLLKKQLQQKERMLWVMQLECERYKDENDGLRKAMQYNL